MKFEVKEEQMKEILKYVRADELEHSADHSELIASLIRQMVVDQK